MRKTESFLSHLQQDMSPKKTGYDLDQMILSPTKENDLALLTGGDIKRPKLKRRFTRLSLSGVKGPTH
jgi:hypothetical protein